MPKYKIAEVVFNTSDLDEKLEKYLKKYRIETKEQSQLEISVTQSQVEYEQSLAINGVNEAYAYGLAILRQLVEYIVEHKNGLLLHASAVVVDDEAYLFTAKSGTGKSTHVQNYKKLFGERAIIINDDKPIIRFVDGAFYVYGTPWSGKANINFNGRAKIKAICSLERAEENSIEKLAKDQAGFVMLNQTVRFSAENLMEKLLETIEKILGEVRFYKLKCNKEVDSAKLSFKAMSEGWFYEN